MHEFNIEMHFMIHYATVLYTYSLIKQFDYEVLPLCRRSTNISNECKNERHHHKTLKYKFLPSGVWFLWFTEHISMLLQEKSIKHTVKELFTGFIYPGRQKCSAPQQLKSCTPGCQTEDELHARVITGSLVLFQVSTPAQELLTGAVSQPNPSLNLSYPNVAG